MLVVLIVRIKLACLLAKANCLNVINLSHPVIEGGETIYLLNVRVCVKIELSADVEAHSLRLFARVLRLELHHGDPDRGKEARRRGVGCGIGGGGSSGPLHQTYPTAGYRTRSAPGAHRGTCGRTPR